MGIRYILLLTITVLTYYGASKVLFDKINETSNVIIDEYFHIPQGLEYCKKNFTYWDPKITTLPGLYLVSTALILLECDTYNLRFTNLLASCINLLMLSSILKYIYGLTNEKQSKIVLQALNIALLPPLYFFSHIYYTDTISLTFLLLCSRLGFSNKNKLLTLIFSICSVLVRQTNIIWIAMVFGHRFLELIIRSSRVYGNLFIRHPHSQIGTHSGSTIDETKLKRYYSMSDVVAAFQYHSFTHFKSLYQLMTVNDFLVLSSHIITMLVFVIFIYFNGSIVVGDKTAHQPFLHLPQLFYFLIFYGVFGLPFVLSRFASTLILMIKYNVAVVCITVLMMLIVYFNTIVHPYLLADNRHYTFYIWNRWYGKYEFAKYISVFVYVFLLFSLYDNLRRQNCISFLLPYSIAILIVLCFQQMIEVRYFLIPYVVGRLRFVRPSFKVVIFEFIWYLIINMATFYVFFTKEFYWSNFKDPQRIIW